MAPSMATVPPRRVPGISGRLSAAGPGPMTDGRLKQQLAGNPAWRVLTVDGLNWIDPFTGTVVPAPFGQEEPALAWLRQHRPWQRDGQEVEPKSLAELNFTRWVHWLKARLPDAEHGWLRQFLPDGRWLNPFTGEPVAGIVRDNGRMTIDTVRQLAAVLRDCPPAQSGKPLEKESLAARLRVLVPPLPARRVPPSAAVVPVVPASPVHTPPALAEEARPTATTPVGESTSALEPATGRTAAKTRRPESRSHSRGDRGEREPKSDSTRKKSNQPPTEPSVRVVSGYRILGTLGMGGMSTVYRAVQLSMEREVALKVLDQQGPPDPTYTERFLLEARSAGRISHPNVVTCDDVGVHLGNRLYMALELVTGGDSTQLADKHGGRLPERLALGILRDAARGLGAIHATGLIHRDIKPANLFIAADGSAKLGDLGLVRDTSSSGKYRTLVGIAVGTPAFMSPEQSQGAKGLDIRSDIYALGASVFSLLAGRPPFEADSVFDLVQLILNSPTPDIRSLRPEISPVTAAVLLKAMHKDRGSRYQTPLELLTAADDALARLADVSAAATPEASEPRSTALPQGLDKLRAAGYRAAEVRGKGLIVTIGLGASVLCVVAAPGSLPAAEATDRLDARLRGYLAALRVGQLVGTPATPATLCRALLVDGLSAAVVLVELGPQVLTIACTPGARVALADSRDAHVLTEVSATPAPIPFPTGALLVLTAGLTGKPLVLWGMVVTRCDQGAEAVAGHVPATANGSTIMMLGAPPS